MNPKYKLNNEITELSKWELPPISPDQIQWGYDHCLEKYSHKSRGKIYCLECGNSWKPSNNHKIQICPTCLTRLKMIKHYRFRYNEAAYMAVVQVCGGFQVVRMVWVSKRLALNWKAEYFAKEVMQHWIDEDGNHTTMTISVNSMSAAYDSWSWSSEMKIKYESSYKARLRHNLSPWKTYPKPQILPIFKRNGFKGEFHGISPIEFFPELLRNQHFETLLKAKQSGLLRLCVERSIHHTLWKSVKICLRNKYIVKDAKIWADYIDLLRYFRKDLTNAHYVCPKNLKAEHDRLMVLKWKKQDQLKAEEKRQKAAKDQSEFLLQKSKFFDIAFHEGGLNIIVLNNVEEFIIEGDELHHCVFTNEYYKKPESLILSARKDNKRIETIEVSLTKMDVIQSRGLCNQNSKYHDQIINMIRNNIHQIAQIAV